MNYLILSKIWRNYNKNQMTSEIISTLILITSVLVFLMGTKLYYSFKYEFIGKILVMIGTVGTVISMFIK